MSTVVSETIIGSETGVWCIHVFYLLIINEGGRAPAIT